MSDAARDPDAPAKPSSLEPSPRWKKKTATTIAGAALFLLFLAGADEFLSIVSDPSGRWVMVGPTLDRAEVWARSRSAKSRKLRVVNSSDGRVSSRHPRYVVVQDTRSIERIEPLDDRTVLILGRRGWCLHDPRDDWIDLDRPYPDAAYLSPEQLAELAADPKLVNHYLSRKAKARLNAASRTVRIQEVDRLRLCCPRWTGQTLRVDFERDFDLADYSGAPLAIDQPRKGTLVFEFEPSSEEATGGKLKERNPRGIDATQPPTVSVEFAAKTDSTTE